MSDQFPSLADVIAAHRLVAYLDPHDKAAKSYRCECGWKARYTYNSYPEHVEQMWREACTISTLEQLKAIPPRPELVAGALIKAFGVPMFGAVLELNDDGTWNDFDDDDSVRTAPEDVALPAQLIWRPDWGKQ